MEPLLSRVVFIIKEKLSPDYEKMSCFGVNSRKKWQLATTFLLKVIIVDKYIGLFILYKQCISCNKKPQIFNLESIIIRITLIVIRW